MLHNIGICYTRGEGVPQNHSEAARYFRLAAELGLAKAQFNYGVCSYKGEGVLQNRSEAIRYYRLAADQAHPPAQLALGAMLFLDGPVDERVPIDPRAGAKLLARIVQSEGAEYDKHRLQALELLREHAHQREVVAACCIGCGASRGLKTCERCHVARFCGRECMRTMWPTHKRCCKEWSAQGGPSQ
jgi:TPR repeat protein